MRLMSALLFLSMCACSQDDECVKTNLVSQTTTVRAWMRGVAMVSDTGDLMGPTNEMAYVSQLDTSRIENLATNCAQRLVPLASQTATLKRLISGVSNQMCLTLDIPLTTPGEVPKLYMASETSDGTNDSALVYCTHSFASLPHLTMRYCGERDTNDVPGIWHSFNGDNLSTNGFSNCKLITFERPSFARGKCVRSYPHISFGLPGTGFDFGSAVCTVNNQLGVTVTNCFWITPNHTNLIFSLENGFFKISQESK